jgi:hypothetical protein
MITKEEMEVYLLLTGRWERKRISGSISKFWRLSEPSDDYYGSFYTLDAAYEREVNIYGAAI